MAIEENLLTFFVVYKEHANVIRLLEYDTVENLKLEIAKLFDIPPTNQIINGWKTIPSCDNTILKECVDQNNITSLVIEEHGNNSCEMVPNTNYDIDEALELEASCSCINSMLNKEVSFDVTFNSCTLENAVNKTSWRSSEKKKILLLYFHNQDDIFSTIFCQNLKNDEFTSVLNRSYFLLGWDVCKNKYHNALINALNKYPDLNNITCLVELKIATAILIIGVNDSITIFSIIKGNVSTKDFLDVLMQAENFNTVEYDQEQELNQLNDKTKTENDFDSVKYQKLMADMLGDRDYDSFEFDQHDHLKNKIAFALMGPPKKEIGYDRKEFKKVEMLYQTILKNSNKIAKYKDKVEISFIYNCTEPLPAEKCHRSKKYQDYNSNTDLNPLPIFILRKCHGSENPCRVFVDDIGRTYETWQGYITRNKLHQCQMILPLNGRYEVGNDGEVLLEKHLSPACSINSKLLQGADYVNVASGIFSGGVLIAAGLSSIAVAPALLLTAGVAGLGTAIYSMGRSAYTLHDRSKHKETLSFANAEARGAYLNIVAGSLGFVGAGATMAVSQLAARGVNIGKGAGVVINTINVANIGASGASLVNSGYDVYDQWYNENQTPSLLTIIQLSSSVLFFGNAVYNFRTCNSIVEEAQTRTLRDYQESLRSNRHRKTFTKLLKETIRQNNGNEIQGKAEVISAVRNIQNKDEVFAVLTRSNKNINKHGVTISAINGEITLNGIQIDMNEFISMNKKEAKTLLLNISKSEPTPLETAAMRRIISNTLNNFSLPDAECLARYALKLLSSYDNDIKSKIINTLATILSTLTMQIKETLDLLFPNELKFFSLIGMIIRFFRKVADKLEEQYQLWLRTGDEMHNMPFFSSVDVDKAKRAVTFFENAVDMYYKSTQLTEEGFKDLLKYFYNWLTTQIYEYQEKTERSNKRRDHSARFPTKKVPCSVCGGYYFQSIKK